MKLKLTLIALFFCQNVFSQSLPDTVYNKNFSLFVQLTEKLIKKIHYGTEIKVNKKRMKMTQDSVAFFAAEVRNSLKKLDSIGSSLRMAEFFENGRSARSQNLSSPVAQLECSYHYYMHTLRKSRDSVAIIVSAALLLDQHLKKGYPPSLYCPFLYDEVIVDFGNPPPKPPVKRIIISDTVRKGN